jgi:hypothetical protein
MLRRLFWVMYVLWAALVLYNETTRENGPQLATMLWLLVPPVIAVRLLTFSVRGR